MRKNYEDYGVEEYYHKVGSSYRNPHFPAIKECIFAFMNIWWAHESRHVDEHDIKMLDLAAGSGEATVCILEWWKRCSVGQDGHDQQIDPITNRNDQPRKAFIPPKLKEKRAQSPSSCFPRLGEKAPTLSLTAIDPYTSESYQSRTNLPCHSLSFRDLASGAMPPFIQILTSDLDKPKEPESNIHSSDIVDIAICSFAMHLIESPSELFALLWELSTKVRWLVIISPHKKPEIKENWGWVLWDPKLWQSAQGHSQHEIVKNRVRCRIFCSANI
ncbi:hypothetical protein FRC03_000162 [Tulasnella sp. 419]|nr:hypothetical protein FRC03_000162 [Tulasnella sp. 419]